MILGARGAQRDRQATRKLRNYSKQWNPGDTMRGFLPLVWLEDGRPDFLIGQVWGHPVNDIKALGLHTSFIPSLTDFDKDGRPIGTPDITYQFSRIAPIFVNGQRAGELARTAAKPWPNNSQRDAALDDVKKKYDKNSRTAIKPIIGPAKYVILMEVISIKYVEGQGCVKDSCAISSWPVSDKQLRQLFQLLDNSKFTPEKGAKYFEFEISYPADPDKGVSGQSAVPAGLTSEYMLCNKCPKDFITVESYFPNWSVDSETIRSRATTSVSADAIQDAIRNYCMLSSEFLDTIDSDDDVKTLTNNIEVVAKVITPKFLQREDLRTTLEDAIQKIEQAQEASVATPMPEPSVSTDTAQGAAEVPNLDISIGEGSPRISELLSGGANSLGADPLSIDGDLLDNVDFSGIN